MLRALGAAVDVGRGVAGITDVGVGSGVPVAAGTGLLRPRGIAAGGRDTGTVQCPQRRGQARLPSRLAGVRERLGGMVERAIERHELTDLIAAVAAVGPGADPGAVDLCLGGDSEKQE